jgi:hypothetical protein
VFKGYELKDKIPTFVYTVGGAEVRERITALPEGQGAGIVRSFEVEAGGKPVYFVASEEPNVTLTASVGAFKPAPVQKTFKSPDKSAGQLLEIPPGDKVAFSVTIKAK